MYFIKSFKKPNLFGSFLLSQPYLPSVPVYDKIAATDAGGASEHRTVSVGPVQASARTTICNSKQEGEEFWNKKTLIAFTIVSAHCHCYNILVKKLFKGAPCSWIELPVQ